MELVNRTWSKHCAVRRQGELTTSFADCRWTAAWEQRCRRAVFRGSIEGSHLITRSVQEIVTMPSSRLRSCFHLDVFGRNLVVA
jgi:hypothetical protein